MGHVLCAVPGSEQHLEQQLSRVTLLDLRRYAIRNRARIHFTLEQAGECIVNEHGLLRLPSLRGVPDFNVETALGSVEQFLIAPVRESSQSQKLSRQQLQALLGDASQADHAHEE